ncbi:MAG: hypothetical protein M0Q26_05890 [Chitinophagaceae bacterium]|nr:hypothetical protein [Chitinophagaceae bacterium]MDP1763414.1 hypothetical protein [Sediminibacterium sp.]
MQRQVQLQATRPHPQYPHFKLVYDLPSPVQTVDDAASAAHYMRSVWAETIDIEVGLMVLMLNQYRQPIAHHHVLLGNPAYQMETLTHLRMIGWITAQSCASSIYLANNVPGELYLTKEMELPIHVNDALYRISKAMDTLDIWLEDHLLLTPVDHLSLKDRFKHDWVFITGNQKEASHE